VLGFITWSEIMGRWIGPSHAATLPLKYDGRRNKCA